MQVDLFAAAAAAENPLHRQAYEELMALDLNGMSPLQAMMKLHDLQQKLQQGVRDGNAAIGLGYTP
jgi:hypothetical protein